jgi:hypothetical protein
MFRYIWVIKLYVKLPALLLLYFLSILQKLEGKTNVLLSFFIYTGIILYVVHLGVLLHIISLIHTKWYILVLYRRTIFIFQNFYVIKNFVTHQ